MTNLTFQAGQWIWQGGYETRATPKTAGFRWDPSRVCWWTEDAAKAARLADHADDAARAALNGQAATSTVSQDLAASRATETKVEIPCPPGLEYRPFQRAGIAYALKRPATLIADEMGLGKTIQGIGFCNVIAARSILVICPASLKLNWAREFKRWTTTGVTIGIAAGDTWPTTDVVIVNYDILERHQSAVRSKTWDVLIVDECQYTKNRAAKRTKQVWGQLAKTEGKWAWKIPPIPATRRLALTGTPLVNRPVDLYPILNGLDHKAWPKFFAFTQRYCDAKKTRFGWDFTGASNLDELQQKLRSTVMVRRLKSEVLSELPPKTRQVIEVPCNGFADVVKAEADAFESHRERVQSLQAAVEAAALAKDKEAYAEAVNRLREAQRVAFSQMSLVRHETAMAKAPLVADHILDCLEQGIPHLLCFAHHHDVVDLIRDRLIAAGRRCVIVTGRESMAQRQDAVDAFQRGEVHVFIGNIQAAGVGLTLTRASHVVFAELDWVPGNVSQAEDRCHRIGQRDGVLIQHLVLEGSLDAKMARTIVAKQEVIDAALDDQPAPPPAPRDPGPPAKTEDLGSLDRILAFLGRAQKNGLTYPTVRLRTTAGQDIKITVCGKQSRTQGAIRVTNDAAYGSPNRKYFGLIHPPGRLERGRDCTDDIVATLRAFAIDPVKTAKLFGNLTNNCCFCGKDLSNPPSVNAGYGPVCAAKYELPWGDQGSPTEREVFFFGQQDGNVLASEEAGK